MAMPRRGAEHAVAIVPADLTRGARSIKGAARLVRLDQAAGLAGRVDEVLSAVRQGKGRKERCTPLTRQTMRVIRGWLALSDRKPMPVPQ